jgi:hypothetical protein
LKSGSLNLLEPSGPVEACNGIALPFNREGITEHWKLFGSSREEATETSVECLQPATDSFFHVDVCYKSLVSLMLLKVQIEVNFSL